jgi:DNA repair protein RecO (recombination protein O)
MQYIITSKLEKLYTFLVKPEVLNELRFVMKRYMSLHVDKEFKSLEILNALLK